MRRNPRANPLPSPWQAKWLDLECHHPDIVKLGAVATKFAKNWFECADGPSWVVVHGEPGCGKTHVAQALSQWAAHVAFTAWEKHWGKRRGSRLPRVEFIDWAFVASPESHSDADWRGTLSDAGAASVVFVDDLGTETDKFKTGIPVQRLTQLLNRREHQFLWVTTNIHPKFWKARWDPRVEDRLLSAQIVEINAPSFRSETTVNPS